MSHHLHHALIVTTATWNSDLIDAALVEARRLGLPTAGPVLSPINGDTRTLLIAPDGSWDGWAESDEYDRRRDRFIAWLRSHRLGGEAEGDYEGNRFSWLEVAWGDNDAPAVTRHEKEDVVVDDSGNARLVQVGLRS